MSKGLQKELPEAHIIRVHTVEFYVDIFPSTGKSWENITGPRKSLEICLTQAIEFSEFTL